MLKSLLTKDFDPNNHQWQQLLEIDIQRRCWLVDVVPVHAIEPFYDVYYSTLKHLESDPLASLISSVHINADQRRLLCSLFQLQFN